MKAFEHDNTAYHKKQFLSLALDGKAATPAT